MSPTSERVTRTTTVRREGANELKSNLSNIASEIARVRDQAREEVNSLEKIRGMLDVGYLNDLIRSVEELETRIQDLEQDSLHARGDAERVSAELQQEQERLAKLWDAYKAQEDELERLRRDYPLMEEKLFERERTIDALRRELDKLEPQAQYRSKFEEADALNRDLRRQIANLELDLQERENQMAEAREELDSLQSTGADAGRVAELEALLEEEKERLAKLYRLYEDMEAEKEDVDRRLGVWEEWFERAKPVFASVGLKLEEAPV